MRASAGGPRRSPSASTRTAVNRPPSAKTRLSPGFTGRAGLSSRVSAPARVRRTRPSSTMRAASERVLKNRARQSQTSTRSEASAMRLLRPPPGARSGGQPRQRRERRGVRLAGALARPPRLRPAAPDLAGPAADRCEAEPAQDGARLGLAPAELLARLVGEEHALALAVGGAQQLVKSLQPLGRHGQRADAGQSAQADGPDRRARRGQ